ncbi:sigma-70 family RNA polymerase sigma factor [Nocardia wallacei]|uniref:sigma-70 family RNA polymerase sigma factor n=1 Tax=Nocardia wallacei TaxID=480035 RepID=UPI0024542E29|nr:sigma-70 family RNA polymerase sigma factor [Nocardia wallacei]
MSSCLTNTVRAAWADGYDNATIPTNPHAHTWNDLTTALHTHLHEIPIPTTQPGTDPLHHIIDTILDPTNNTISATIIIDDGTTAHGYYITHTTDTHGQPHALIYDTNTPTHHNPNPPPHQPTRIPRLRTHTQWTQSYPHIHRAFITYFHTTPHGTLQPTPPPPGTNLHGTTNPIQGPPSDGRRNGDIPERWQLERIRDQERIAAIRAGDLTAFDGLYRDYYGLALSAAMPIVRDRAAAEDVVADTFATLLEQIRRGVGPQEGFAPYLAQAVRRAALRFRDRADRMVPVEEAATLDRRHLDREPAHTEAEAGDSAISGAFESLPDELRRVLWLVEVEGYSSAEVAEQLGTTSAAIDDLTARARAELAAAFAAARPERGPFVAALAALAADGEGLTDALAAGDETLAPPDETLATEVAVIDAARGERQEDLGMFVRRLRPETRECFVRWFMGQPVADIAAATGQRRSVIEPRLASGIRTVAKMLTGEEITPERRRAPARPVASDLTDEMTLLVMEAVWAHEPELLESVDPPLSAEEREWFEPYFVHGRTVPDIAASLGRKPRSVRRRLHRLAQRLATGLEPGVVERYLSGGRLRAANRMDVAREAGVSEPTVKRVLRGQLDANPETIERIRAAARRLGVGSGRPGVVADGDEATSSSPVPIVRDDDRVPYQLRGKELQIVRAAPAADLRRLIPFLSQGDQQVARLLLLESVSATTAAQRLDRPVPSIRQAQHRIAVLLAAMLTTENWDLLLAEAVAAHDPAVLAEAFSKLTPTQRLYADLYLTRGRSTADIAAARGVRQDTVNRLLQRIGRVLVRELPSILVRHYMSQGPLRRATLADVAAGSGVSEVTARRVLTTGGGDPRTAQRIRAEAERLGWTSRRPGVVVGRDDGTSPVPVASAGTVDYPRRGRAFRIIRAADPDVLAASVDMLPPAYRVGGTLLYSDELTIAEKSRALGLSSARISMLRQVAAPRLATLLSTGVLLSDGTALSLVEAVAANQPELLTPCYSQLSQIEWEYADLYLVQGLSQPEVAEATNRSPSTVRTALYRIAHILAAELPTGVVRQTIELGSLRRVTLADIAEQAGVSKVSADRVLNGRGGTNAETAQRVRATAERFGWTPQRRGIVAETAAGLLPAGEFPWHAEDYSDADDVSGSEPNAPTPWSDRRHAARSGSNRAGRTPWTEPPAGDYSASPAAEPAQPHPVPEHVRKCVVQTVRAAWAVGYDGALIPTDDADSWDELETSLGTHLSPTPIAATTDENHDPLGYLLDAIADPDNDLDSAVIVVDEGDAGGRAHGYLATSVAGEVVIFDTNIPSRAAGPEAPDTRVARVRTRANWRQSFPRAQRAFVLEFVATDQGLQPRPGRRPDPADRSHRRRRILGPPTGEGPERGSGPVRRWRADGRELSRRELQVLTLVYEGLSVPEIASRFGLEVGTVRNHLSNAVRLLGAGNLIQAVAEVRHRGLVGTGDRPQAATSVRLSPQDLELLRLMTEGLTDRIIARRLGVAEYTVQRRRDRIGVRLGVEGRTPIALTALRLGLLDRTDDADESTAATEQPSARDEIDLALLAAANAELARGTDTPSTRDMAAARAALAGHASAFAAVGDGTPRDLAAAAAPYLSALLNDALLTLTSTYDRTAGLDRIHSAEEVLIACRDLLPDEPVLRDAAQAVRELRARLETAAAEPSSAQRRSARMRGLVVRHLETDSRTVSVLEQALRVLRDHGRTEPASAVPTVEESSVTAARPRSVTAPSPNASLFAHVLPTDVHSAEILGGERGSVHNVRLCTEQVLRKFGMSNAPITVADDGPRWPDDTVGATARTTSCAVAAVASRRTVRALGLDAREHLPVEATRAFFTARWEERGSLRRLAREHPGVHWQQVLASAKDNAADVHHRLTGQRPGPADLAVDLHPDPVDPRSGWFEARVPGADTAAYSGRYRAEDVAVTAITVRHNESDAEARAGRQSRVTGPDADAGPHRLLTGDGSVFAGTVHRSDPDHPQSELLTRRAERWAAETAGQNRVIAVEGRVPQPGATARESFAGPRGEMAMMAYIGREHDIDVVSLEEQPAAQVAALIEQGHDRDAVFLYYILRQMPQGLRAEVADMDSHLQEALDLYSFVLPEGVDARTEFFRLMAREYPDLNFPRNFAKFDENWLLSETTDMDERTRQSRVRAVAIACQVRREHVAAQKIRDYMAAGTKVFAAYGEIHFENMRPMLPAFAAGPVVELGADRATPDPTPTTSTPVAPVAPVAPANDAFAQWLRELQDRGVDTERMMSNLETVWDYLSRDPKWAFRPEHEYDAVAVFGSPDIGTSAVVSNFLAEHDLGGIPVVFSGWAGKEAGSRRPEAETFRVAAERLGLNAARAIEEPHAQNTRQNAINTVALLRERGHGTDSLVIACTPQHARRVWATIKKQTPEVRHIGIVTPHVSVDNYIRHGLRSEAGGFTAPAEIVSAILSEVRGLMESPARGHIVEQEIPAEIRDAYTDLTEALARATGPDTTARRAPDAVDRLRERFGRQVFQRALAAVEQRAKRGDLALDKQQRLALAHGITDETFQALRRGTTPVADVGRLLATVCGNRIRQYVDFAEQRQRIRSALPPEVAAGPRGDELIRLTREELRQRLSVLSKTSPAQHRSLTLRRIWGLTVDQTAAAMKLPAATVRILDHYAAQAIAGVPAAEMTEPGTNETPWGVGFPSTDAPRPAVTLPHKLTDTQIHVVAMMAAGRTSAEIADALDLTPANVNTAKAHLAREFRTGDTAEIVAAARSYGILPPAVPSIVVGLVPQQGGRSAEEARFLEWYWFRTADRSNLPRQGLAEYLEMHQLEPDQARRWLSNAGIGPDAPDIPPIGRFTGPSDDDPAAWLPDVRRYLGVAPERMDDLIGAPPGTWAAAERGEGTLRRVHVRTLLRRVPGARRTYRSVARLFPDLLTATGEPAYPEGYPHNGAYLRHLRESAGWSRPMLAERIRKWPTTIEEWENGTVRPPRDVVEELFDVLPFPTDVTYDEFAAGSTYLPREPLLFPSPYVAGSFGEYLRHFRRVNHLTRTDAGRLLGLFVEAIEHHEDNPAATGRDLTMLRLFHRVLHRAGPWNDLADAWGFSYRMDPAGETIPVRSDYVSDADWLKAMRLYHRLTQAEMGRRMDRPTRYISERENGAVRPRPEFLREVAERLGVPRESRA